MENNYTLERYLKSVSSIKKNAQLRFSSNMRYLAAAFLLAMAPGVDAQVNSTFAFNSDLQGWTTDGFGTFNQTVTQACGGGSSARANVFYDGTNNFISPNLGVATAGLVTVSFDYKVVEYAALDASPSAKVLILSQWSNSAAGPWTTFNTINSGNHIASASCATKSATFTPTPGPLFIKFQNKAVGAGSDIFYYYDNIVVSQAADGPCAAVSVPYTMPLEAAVVPALPECVTIENVNADDKFWVTLSSTEGITGKVMRYAYSTPNAANDWFYTRKLNLTAGTSYRVSFKYKITGFVEKLKVAVGTSATASAMTQTLVDLTIPSNIQGGQLKVVDFIAPTTGVYNIGFQAHSDAYMNELYVGEISVVASPTCLPPVNSALTAGSLTQTGFSFSWTASTSAPALGYDYEVRSSGAAGSGATGLAASGTVAAGVTTATVTGLTNSTSYTVYIRAKCSASVSSAWTGSLAVTTVCGVANIPYIMPIESAVVPGLPSCVTIENVNNDDRSWQTAADTFGIAGKVMEYPYSFDNDANDWFYSTSLNLTAGTSYRLSFKYRITGYEEKLKVAVGSSATASAMTQTLIDLTIPANVNAAQLQIIDFTVPTTGVYNLGFQAHSLAYQNSLFVGEVSVDFSPSCVAPSNVLVNSASITQTGFAFNWTASPSAPADGYQYEVRTSGAAGSGTTGLAASGSTAAGVTTATVTGLSASNSYTTFVRAKCSGTETSAWAAAPAITTVCGVANIPYVMPLASAVIPALPMCVTMQNLNNDTSFWATSANTAGITGPVMQYNYSLFEVANDWFYSAPLNLTAGVNYQLSFKYKVVNFEEKLKVAVGASANAAAMTQTLIDLTIPASTQGGNLQLVNFMVATTGVYNLGFQAHSDADKNYLYVGEVSVTVAAAAICDAPTGVIATDLDKTSVTIAWDAPATAPANGYSYEIRTSGLGGSGATGLVSAGTTPAGITTMDISNLVPNTDYSVYVSSNCGTGNMSMWTVAVQFTTLCDYLVLQAINDTTCVGSTATLQVSGATTEVTWYATDTSLEVIGAGPIFETPELLQNTSYWAQATTGSGATLCTAPSRTEVIATVNAVPVITGDHVQTVTVDALEDATLANLEPSGANVTWFPTEADAIAYTNELEIGTQLNSGTTYYAVLTENDCRSLPFSVLVTVELGLENQTMNGLSYYPNPVLDNLNIMYSENIMSVTVFNLVGQKVMTITPNATNVVLDMSRLSAGTYMVHITADSASKVIKLIKK